MPAEPAASSASQPQVRLLGDHVCNKIAAGEVIERPASVFKELVENSLDAGADAIEVEVLQGGRKAVILQDNGCGMNRDNALLAMERHATSKIRDVDDIEHIDTMGFRGEALAAIAAVSRFTLRSRPREELAGVELMLEGGTMKYVEESGSPPGTRIEVRNLFFNVPSRRKFLRTEATELANIRSLFHVFALAHPTIAFRLKVDGRELEHFPKQHSLSDRIADLYGDEVFSRLRKLELEQGDLKIRGFCSLPDLHRSHRRDQVLLINRRPATAPLLAYAIREAYRDSLPRDRHPLLFLHIDMPPDWVDVNVHPTKREVRFGPGNRIRDALLHGLEDALRCPEASTQEAEPPEEDLPMLPPQLSLPPKQEELPPPTYPPIARPLQRATPPPPAPASPPSAVPAHRSPSPSPDLTGSESTGPNPGDANTEAQNSPWGELKPLARYDQRFWLLEGKEALILLDPVAARERVFYEETRDRIESAPLASQGLLVPETLELRPAEAERLRRHRERLQQLGFAIEEFGGDSFLIEALPALLAGQAPGTLLLRLLEEISEAEQHKGTPREIRERVARSCCRLAAEQSRLRSPQECEALLKRLGACEMPYTTPHGRPTLIHMSFPELRRKFGL